MADQTAGQTAGPTAGPTRQHGFMAKVRAVPMRVWVGLVVAALALAFILQNRNTAGLYLLQISVHAPMWVFLLVTWLIGALVGVLFARRRRRDS